MLLDTYAPLTRIIVKPVQHDHSLGHSKVAVFGKWLSYTGLQK